MSEIPRFAVRFGGMGGEDGFWEKVLGIVVGLQSF